MSAAALYSERLQRRLQSATNLIYYPFEDIALAGGIAPKLFPVDEAWWWAKSDWAWVGASTYRALRFITRSPFLFSLVSVVGSYL